MSEHFPYSPAAAAFLCDWTDDDYGLQRIHWANVLDEGENFNATVGLIDGRNILRFAASDAVDERFASAAIRAVDECLRESRLSLDDIDAIAAAPARPRYRADLAAGFGVPEERIIVSHDENMHTASLAAAFDRAAQRLRLGDGVLLVAAGAGHHGRRHAVPNAATSSVDHIDIQWFRNNHFVTSLHAITIRSDTSPESRRRPMCWSPRAAPTPASGRCE